MGLCASTSLHAVSCDQNAPKLAASNMVYCGKPSANCGNCRTRKRRCDKAVPSCGQCRRSGLDCPGYQDTSRLVFRNETARIIGRACAKYGDDRGAVGNTEAAPQQTPSTRGDNPPPRSTATTDTASISDASRAFWETMTPPTDGMSGLLPTSYLESSYMQHQRGDGDWFSSPGVDLCPGLMPRHSQGGEQHGSQHQQQQLNGQDNGWLSQLYLPLELIPPNCLGDAQIMDAAYVPADSSIRNSDTSLEESSKNLDKQAVDYFVTNFVVNGSGPSAGFMNYINDPLDQQGPESELLKLAVRSVGLACLAQKAEDKAALNRAWASYTASLRQVNALLQRPEDALKDTTICVMLLLGLFISITCSDDNSLQLWASYIDRASSLLINRGNDQFKTKQGLHIFQEAVSQLLHSYTYLQQPIPPRIRLLRLEASRFIPADSPAWVVSSAQIETLDLTHCVKPERTDTFLPNEWEYRLVQAIEIDRRLEAFFADLPTTWQFKQVRDPRASPILVHRGNFHIYHDTWIAKIWNGMRCCRIMLSQIITCLLQREASGRTASGSIGGDSYAKFKIQAVSNMEQMRDGILASVPQMLGYVRHETATSTSFLDCSIDRQASSAHNASVSGAYFLMWHIYVAGNLDINLPETRVWVTNRLRAMRALTGIQQTEYLADSLEAESELSA